MNISFSVICPVFNTNPKLIKKCLNSIFNTKEQKLEIIVVNDGSTSKKTIDYLKLLTNKNIKVINQENRGLGPARNAGLNKASNEYILFLDSDDTIDPTIFKTVREYHLQTTDFYCFKFNEINLNEITKNIS